MTLTPNELADKELANKERRLEEVKARLEERGLLRSGGHQQPLPEVESRTIVLPDAGDGGVGTASAIVVAGSPCIDVPCPACGPTSTRAVPVNRTRFDCRSCGESWRWSICSSCDRLAVTSESLDGWECRGCGGVTRSWWRSTLPTIEPARIIQRRTVQLTALQVAHGQAVHSETSKRRSRVVAAVVGAAVIAVAGLAIVDSASGIGAKGAACGEFRRLVDDAATGRLTPADLQSRLDAIAHRARGIVGLEEPATTMRADATLSSVTFQAAKTQFLEACRGG
ncbi:MAG TPA: hypothetical protein VM345_16010 [Acidimicrobiales bacterium]|nr:hypothetical protein [Acidimicrobiales bacterium]